MYDEHKLITLKTAKLAKDKKVIGYSTHHYYIVSEDTYHEDYHNGIEYLAHEKGEILCATTPPYDTKYEKIANAYTQTKLQQILRDDYSIHIEIIFVDQLIGYKCICTNINTNTIFFESEGNNTYEDTLEIGLINMLYQINYSKL
jgi:hypothetical protein